MGFHITTQPCEPNSIFMQVLQSSKVAIPFSQHNALLSVISTPHKSGRCCVAEILSKNLPLLLFCQSHPNR